MSKLLPSEEQTAVSTEAAAFDAQAFLATLTQRPGVYQMLDRSGGVLYVGKAKNLRKRVASYFRSSGLAVKTRALVGKIASIQITVTHSETEALLLEQNLIKTFRPPYNILLRDDKSYPYIFISDGQPYPALRFRRGARKGEGRYFGPYPSGGAVRESLNLLQKIFRVRQCEDSFFRNRTRPCLQHQIKRCSAPCVGLISEEDYRQDIDHAMLFLEGKSHRLRDGLARRMEQAAEALQFEQAAHYRDQIINLQRVQEQQYVSGFSGDADVFACATRAGLVVVHALHVSAGRIIGSRSHLPKVPVEQEESQILSSFVAQYYLSGAVTRPVPPLVLVSHPLEDCQSLEQVLSDSGGRKVALQARVRSERAAWLRLAQTNAEQQLTQLLANQQQLGKRFIALQEALDLDNLPQRLECFDISHSSGEATVASCVVFDGQGPKKADYRRFNIEGITGGDDYAAMRQALERRFRRLKKGEGKHPDLLIIDGGKGQVHQAEQVLAGLAIEQVQILGVAKGVTRRPGLETLIYQGQEVYLDAQDAALHLIQHIRDEAHRFAITGHRQRRAKARRESPLESIPGVGPKRRRALLQHFGGWQEVERASVEEIAKVSTISRTLAEQIFLALHPE